MVPGFFLSQIRAFILYFCNNYVSFWKLVPPQVMPMDFGDEPINTGDSIGIQCMANKGTVAIYI